MDGSYYEGEFFNGKPNGKCFMIRPDNGRYDGDWVNGKKDGYGEE